MYLRITILGNAHIVREQDNNYLDPLQYGHCLKLLMSVVSHLVVLNASIQLRCKNRTVYNLSYLVVCCQSRVIEG